MRHLIYLRSTTTLAALVWLIGCVGAEAARPESGGQKPAAAQLKVFLDCEDCYADYLQTSVTFVDYVRDRTEAEVHVLITRAETAAGGFEYTLAFIGRSRFDGLSDTLKTVTETAATDDIIRRQLATSLRAGLVRFLTRDGVPPELKLEVTLGVRGRAAGGRGRSLEELGVQPAGLGLGPGRGVESLARARRERQRRSHHAGLEDHARL